jgi:peptidoglycan glycosyltransferase
VLRTAERFGFYERPPLETPDSERLPSGLYRQGDLWFPERNQDVDAGRMAFGQERLLVTPLQMAMVAATIGNGGLVRRNFVVDKVVSPAGRTTFRADPEVVDRAVKPTTARDVGEMMVRAVEGGTGTAAQIPGARVGGKTGTAETGVDGRNTTWFIAFAGPDDKRASIAIAVVLENQTSTGGATAAPIARAVMQALLASGANT